MAIKSEPQYLNEDDVKNDIRMYTQADPVPVTSQPSEDAWTLNLMNIDWPAGPGHIEGGAVAVGAYAERYIPGLLDGHLYRITVHFAGSLDRLRVTIGEIILGHVGITAGGITETKIWTFRPMDGNHLLKFEHHDGSNFTGAVSIVKIEALDPMNLDLIPETTPREV
jgi:hypothetical protein